MVYRINGSSLILLGHYKNRVISSKLSSIASIFCVPDFLCQYQNRTVLLNDYNLTAFPNAINRLLSVLIVCKCQVNAAVIV